MRGKAGSTKADAENVLRCIMEYELRCAWEPCNVVTVNAIMASLSTETEKVTRYRAKRAIKQLVDDGFIEYKSIGRPAEETCDEGGCELVCEALPPLNGYALCRKAFETDMWKKMESQSIKAELESWGINGNPLCLAKNENQGGNQKWK